MLVNLPRISLSIIGLQFKKKAEIHIHMYLSLSVWKRRSVILGSSFCSIICVSVVGQVILCVCVLLSHKTTSNDTVSSFYTIYMITISYSSIVPSKSLKKKSKYTLKKGTKTWNLRHEILTQINSILK